MVALLSARKDVRPKDVLVILDSCFSSVFADEVLTGGLATHNLHILSAGEGVVMTSLIVFSDCDDGRFVNECRDGSGAKYGIFGCMMMRELMNLIAFTSENPSLKEIPGRLHERVENDVLRGFTCKYGTSVPGQSLTLRDFFCDAVDPKREVLLGNQKCLFEKVLRPLPSTGCLFDDYCSSWQGEANPQREEHSLRSVTITQDNNQDGFRVVKYENVDMRLRTNDAKFRHIISGKLDRKRNDRTVHVLLCDLFDQTLVELADVEEHVREVDDEKAVRECHDILVALNDISEGDRFYLPIVIEHWHTHTVDEWRAAFALAHSKLSRREEGRLRSKPPGASSIFDLDGRKTFDPDFAASPEPKKKLPRHSTRAN
jgi:hypothetical protein